MARIHITFPLHTNTVERLGLKEEQITQLDKTFIFYEPKIGQKQHWDAKGNSMYAAMEKSIKEFKPDVIVIGNNRVPDSVLDRWKEVTSRYTQDRSVQPMIIRRGIELGGIPIELAKQYGIHLKNIPAINSPYVARHMLRQLNFSKSYPGQSIAVIGAGDIGLPIIKAAVRNGLNVRVVSDSLINTTDNDRRNHKIEYIRSYLEEHRLSDANVYYPSTIEKALQDAEYVAISVPWWLKDKQRHNIDMINSEQLDLLTYGASIVSCSNPRIFTEEALHWMNQEILSQRLSKVRIDTGHSYAAEVYERYHCNELDVKAGQAFYCADCLIRLDRALLNKVYQHAGLSPNALLMAMPRPQDDMDIESYVVDFHHFFDTEKVFFNISQQKTETSSDISLQKRSFSELRCM